MRPLIKRGVLFLHTKPTDWSENHKERGILKMVTNTRHETELRGSLAALERDLLETQVNIRRARRWTLAHRGQYQAVAAGELADEASERALSAAIKRGRARVSLRDRLFVWRIWARNCRELNETSPSSARQIG